MAYSVSNAVSIAGGHTNNNLHNTPGQVASRWFIDHYPLLGGLASHFKIVEDFKLCNNNDIHIAAINVSEQEIYINPAADLTEEELKFVLAHEYLHAGLMHQERCNGRDQYLWNVACDYVINSWLHELQIGVMPSDGLLYDASLAGLSAESIYDLILMDIKKYSKLDTFRGFHKGDIVGEGVDTLEQAKDFPKDGPILIITDGCIESHLDITHEHAYLIPKGMRLPFRAKGEVFYFSE